MKEVKKLNLQRDNITLETDWDYIWDEPIHWIRIRIPELSILGVKCEDMIFSELITELDKACDHMISDKYIEKNSLDDYWYFTDEESLDLEQVRDIIIELANDETFINEVERVCLAIAKGEK